MSRSGTHTSMSRRGSVSSIGSRSRTSTTKSIRPFTAPPPPPKRIDRLVPEPSFEAYWPEAGAEEAGGARVWQVQNFTTKQIRQLVPEIEVPDPPKAARDAYWFFDRDKRPTLDNDKLFAEARKDRSRPKLSTMQARAIDALWDECDDDERAMYEELAEQDKQRYDDEMASTAKVRADMQVQAAKVELTQWLQSIGLQEYDQKLKSSGLSSIKQMSEALRNGRWSFLGRLEDAGFTNDLHQQVSEKSLLSCQPFAHSSHTGDFLGRSRRLRMRSIASSSQSPAPQRWRRRPHSWPASGSEQHRKRHASRPSSRSS